jgi:hypothetical protein
MRRSVAAGAPLVSPPLLRECLQYHICLITIFCFPALPAFVNASLMLLKILMLRSRANALETTDHRAQYVACLFFSRLLEGL